MSETPIETELETVEVPETVEEQPTEPDTFPRSYVEELRTEAAAHRVRANELEAARAGLTGALQALAVEHYARGVLTDVAALQWSDDMAGDDGLPDGERIRQAAEQLVAERPSLGRPQGQVLQGAHGETAQGFSWGVLSGLV